MTAPAPTRRDRTPAAHTDAWMAYGLCRQVDPDLFFPDGRGAAITIQTEQAKKVCGDCPVRALCLDWAITTGQTAGVWGGMAEDERRELTGDRSGQYARCINAQAFIERRIGEAATYRQIAEELKVGHHAVCRAVKFFRREREAVNAA